MQLTFLLDLNKSKLAFKFLHVIWSRKINCEIYRLIVISENLLEYGNFWFGRVQKSNGDRLEPLLGVLVNPVHQVQAILFLRADLFLQALDVDKHVAVEVDASVAVQNLHPLDVRLLHVAHCAVNLEAVDPIDGFVVVEDVRVGEVHKPIEVEHREACIVNEVHDKARFDVCGQQQRDQSDLHFRFYLAMYLNS